VWRSLNTVPTDGRWVLVTVPGSKLPAVARPVSPGSYTYENFWNDVSFIASDHSMWMPIPDH
jgi:hypothetical protein